MSNEAYKEYILRHYHKCEQYPNHDNRYQTFKARPYDDAKYWWAYSHDKQTWYIVFDGKRQHTFNGTFESVVDIIEEENKKIKSKMIHW